MGAKNPFSECTGFEWDENKVTKNWVRHQVTPEEAEDVFFHDPLVVRFDVAHSKCEKRYWALGKTARDRKLFIVFTIRKKLIRVISVRDMSNREAEEYDRYEETDS